MTFKFSNRQVFLLAFVSFLIGLVVGRVEYLPTTTVSSMVAAVVLVVMSTVMAYITTSAVRFKSKKQ